MAASLGGGINRPARGRGTYILELSEGDELHNVPHDRLAFGGAKDPIIPIQDLHVREVSVAHPHNDDGHGQVGGPDDGFPRVRHVSHNPVSQDQQDEVLL